MAKINSNTQVAQQLASELLSALDVLNTSTSINQDGQTTVAGNDSAKEAIHAAQQAVTQVSSAIGNAAANLQSVAAEFDAKDRAIKNTVFGSLPKPESRPASGGIKLDF
ncbi:TIGR04197 family type VII secretion effector [Enterococcus sp. LJL128]|uniref:TIGR04197 family type VII secretion effector n=1 Tax=Enterococcus sp. LJL51 TaxID=3416656 RepID=UPI003CFAB241